MLAAESIPVQYNEPDKIIAPPYDLVHTAGHCYGSVFFHSEKADPFGKAEAPLRAVSFFLMLYYFDQT